MTEYKPKNIVFVYVDDLGYGDVGCYGATRIRTPNIDRLAAEGLLFRDAHAPSAVCTPSRYGLLTGNYPFRADLWGPHPFNAPLTIGKEQYTMAKLFRDRGYATACIGKWHLGFCEEEHDYNTPLKPGPLELGFDYYFGIPQVSSGPPFVYVENYGVVGYDPDDPFVPGQLPDTKPHAEKNHAPRIGGAQKAHRLYDDELVGTELTERAVKWIREHREKPFFLYFPTTNIHHPFTPHPRFKGSSECGRYGDFIQELDWLVGEVIGALEADGLFDDTLFVFASDNGGMFNEGGKDAWAAGHRMNGGLLGFKFGAWEGGHRIPQIIRWPGHVPAGEQTDALFSQVDFLHTFAGLLGATLPHGHGVDSYNQLPLLLGETNESARDHAIIAPNDKELLGLRDGNWVFIPGQGDGGFKCSRGGPWAAVLAGQKNSDLAPNGGIREDAPDQQLYNLKDDPYQTTNVIESNPDVARRMREKLKELAASDQTRP
ncbi:MAG: arylsulfatase [Kiritimatiellia bacterium]